MSVPDIELYYYDGANFTSFNAPIQSVSISRGRSRQLNRFDSGSAVINFYNGDRLLDPLNDDSAYQSLIVPRLQLQVLADSVPVYSGVVKDWDIDYDLTDKDLASASCSDLFTVLANAKFLQEVPTVTESCDDRINFVLTHFGFVFDTDLDTGNATLGPFPIAANTQALDYLFNVASSDQGNIFVSADNALTFVGRYGRPPVSELTFADDGTGIDYSSLTNEYGDELLVNKVVVSSPISSGEAENATSITDYGEVTFTFSNALNYFSLDTQWIAEDIIDLYSEPNLRFTGLSVQLAGLSSADVADVLALDLCDQVSVKKSFSVGTPSSVTQDLIVTGIRHTIVPGSHVVQFIFEPTPYRDVLILDDSVNGLLDTDKLG
jgi:hypothetical protein